VSHQLRGLEERLGTAVFERNGRALRLTATGERMLEIARDVLGSLARAESTLLAELSRRRETLRVASECHSAYLWLPRALNELGLQHPNVDLVITGEPAGGMRDALAGGDLDLALCVSPLAARGLDSVPLFADELVLVVASDHPLARRPWVDGRSLANETLILYETTQDERRRVARSLFARGGGFARVIRMPITEAIFELVRAGVGVSILPSASAQHRVERGELVCVRLTRRGLGRTWAGYFRRGTALGGPIRTLLETARIQSRRALLPIRSR
jgi:LysR family transcriptional regulator for metE and metH